MRHLLSIAATLLLVLSMSDAKAATRVYIGSAAGNSVAVMALDPASGELSEIETIALGGAPGGSTPMAVSPDKRLLFVAQRSEPFRVKSFGIDPQSGRLKLLAEAPLPASMAAIETDRAGKFLFAASYPHHLLSVSPIGPDGVTGEARQVIDAIPNAHSIKPDAANCFVLAASLGSDSLRIFRLGEDGTLVPGDPDRASLPKGTGPRHFVFDSTGRRLYLLAELGGKVFVFDYDSDSGRATQRQEVLLHGAAEPTPANGTWWAADIHITPDDRFLYASVRSNSTLVAFAVAPDTGLLTPIATYPTEAVPRGFAIDPSGRFLFAAGEQSGHVMSYAIDPESGELRPLRRYRVGDGPNWIEILTLPQAAR